MAYTCTPVSWLSLLHPVQYFLLPSCPDAPFLLPDGFLSIRSAGTSLRLLVVVFLLFSSLVFVYGPCQNSPLSLVCFLSRILCFLSNKACNLVLYYSILFCRTSALIDLALESLTGYLVFSYLNLPLFSFYCLPLV